MGPARKIAGARRTRGWLVAALVLVAAGAILAGQRLLRTSPPQTVRHVTVTGLAASDAREIVSALTAAAVGQRSDRVGTAELRAAVAPFAQVRGLSVRPLPAGGLRIAVDEQLPVADLTSPGGSTAATADGTILGAALVNAHFPAIDVTNLPSSRVANPLVLEELSLLGAAPDVLLHRAMRVYSGPLGLSVVMHNGLLIVFGDLTQARAKWIAAEDVLVDSHSVGASYIDVRTPQRPAAGGLPAAQAPAEGVTPTAATLAAQLEAAVTGAAATEDTDAGPDTGLFTATPGGSVAATPNGADATVADGSVANGSQGTVTNGSGSTTAGSTTAGSTTAGSTTDGSGAAGPPVAPPGASAGTPGGSAPASNGSPVTQPGTASPGSTGTAPDSTGAPTSGAPTSGAPTSGAPTSGAPTSGAPPSSSGSSSPTQGDSSATASAPASSSGSSTGGASAGSDAAGSSTGAAGTSAAGAGASTQPAAGSQPTAGGQSDAGTVQGASDTGAAASGGASSPSTSTGG